MSVIAFRPSPPHAAERQIPVALVRDLVAVGLLTEDPRPPAWRRLEARLGPQTFVAVRDLLEQN
jgi:hypothetical protein